jgi:hypothetical protein
LPVASLSPAFLYRGFHLYLKGLHFPIESPLWYDRFFWQNPVRVTRSIPPERCPFSSASCHQAGRPSDNLALRPFPASRPSFSFLRPRPFDRWVSSNGGSKLLLDGVYVKGKKGLFMRIISLLTSAQIYKLMN